MCARLTLVGIDTQQLVRGAVAKGASQYRNNTDDTPPGLEVNTCANHGQAGDDTDDSLGLTNIALHMNLLVKVLQAPLPQN